MTRATTKPRKPRRPSNSWSQGELCAWIDPRGAPVNVVCRGMGLRDVRRLHAWLGRYIAWREWLIERRRLKHAA